MSDNLLPTWNISAYSREFLWADVSLGLHCQFKSSITDMRMIDPSGHWVRTGMREPTAGLSEEELWTPRPGLWAQRSLLGKAALFRCPEWEPVVEPSWNWCHGKTGGLVHPQCQLAVLLSQLKAAVVQWLWKRSLQPHHSSGHWWCCLSVLLLLLLCTLTTIFPTFLWEDSIRQDYFCASAVLSYRNRN